MDCMIKHGLFIKNTDCRPHGKAWCFGTEASTSRLACLTIISSNDTSLFQQHRRQLYTWTSLDGQYRNLIDYILWSQRWRSSIQSAKIRPGADSGLDHELLIPKFRLKLKKAGKITCPFRYDLNQFPNDYSEEIDSRD